MEVKLHKMYCVKCRAHFISNKHETVTFKNQKKAIKATCPECQVISYKIKKNED